MSHNEKGAIRRSVENDESNLRTKSKNGKIEDFFNMSGKKRSREEESSPQVAKKEVINLLDEGEPIRHNKKHKIKLGKSNAEKQRINRNNCSICRQGGDLILCDKCPKSFHTTCLKLKDTPEGNWYCTDCISIVERRSKKTHVDLTEQQKKRNEKRRLYRLKKKEEKMKNGNSRFSSGNKKIDPANFGLLPVISEEMQEKISSESRKLESSLMLKLKSGGGNLLTNFILNGKTKEKKRKVVDSIDLTMDDEDNRHFNRIPTEEEAKKFLSQITQNGNIDIMSLNNLAKRNPILYVKVNNLYISSLNNSLPKSSQNVKKLNIKYPIDDDELYANPSIYNLSKEFYDKPRGKKPSIPNESFSKIIKIADFIHTFRNKLDIREFSPELLYHALTYFNEEEVELVNEVHSVLIDVILSSLSKYDYATLLTDEEKDLFLLKIAYENTPAKLRYQYVKKSWPEIVKIVINSEYYKLMVSEDLKDLAHRLKYVNPKNYNLLSLDEKLILLDYLVNTILDTEFVKKTIEEDIKTRAELNKEKRAIQEELRERESRKREIERQDKFVLPKQKIENINKRLQTLVEDNQNLSRHELTKLRKELEQEREKYKSVIKEGEEIEVTINKINTRLEKISLEIYSLPSINKKLLGKDGLKNEYYFYPWINNKIYVKFCSQNGKVRSYEWREITTEEEISELLSKLSEKGNREKSLLHKLKKLLPKRIKLSSMIVEEDCDLSKQILDWTNRSNSETISDYFSNLTSIFSELETEISDYLSQDEKEWESLDMRQNWRAWISRIRNIPEYAKCLLLFNEKFRSPYKMTEFKSKIIQDDDEYMTGQYSIITPEGILDPYIVNPVRISAAKVKLWSRDLESIEDHYIEYVNSIVSFSSLFFGVFVFQGVLNDLFKRREFYKKRENKEESESIKEEKKKIDFDDYFYDENAFKDDFIVNINNSDDRRRSRRLNKDTKTSSFNYSENNTNVNKTTKRINLSNSKEWNDDCMFCGEEGELLCCEDCTNVIHLECTDLKKEPEVWRCQDCIYKMANRRLTRSSNLSNSYNILK